MAARVVLDTPGSDLFIPRGDLTQSIVPRTIPLFEQYRRVYGAQTDLNAIQQAMASAEIGYMTDLCDLESEIIKLDPHLSGLLSKRIGILSAADWDLTPPEGIDRGDLEWATKIASEESAALRAIPYFSERIEDLSWGLYDGRSCLETHWDTNIPGTGMAFAPVGLEWVHPRRLGLGEKRDLRIINPLHSRGFNDPGLGVEDFPGKFVWWLPRLFREYPEREGLGPRAMYWAFFKRFDTIKRMALTELIALPWRLVELDKEAPADADDIKAAKEQANALGGENVAVFGRGTKVQVVSVPQGASEIFKFSHDQVNSELSKLVVGNTGTTDAVANRAESVVHKGEQDIISQRDGNACAARFQHHLIRPMTIHAYGRQAAHLTPKLTIRVQPPRDRKAEQERTKTLLTFGAPVPLAAVYEEAGKKPPANGEPFVVYKAQAGTDSLGNPLPGSFQVVDPSKPEAEGGGPGSDGGSPGNKPAPGSGSPPPGADDAPAPGDEGTVEGDGVDGGVAAAVRDLLAADRSWARIELAAAAGDVGKKQPANAVFGSPEVLIDKGLREGMRAVAKWTAAMLDAAESASTAPQLHKALAKAADGLDVEAYTRAVERRMVHSLALGALDADWEATNDAVVKPPLFDALVAASRLDLEGTDPGFVDGTFDEAVRFFRSKKVMTKRAFDRLAAEAKRRAFTIAGVQKKRVLEVAHRELTRQLESGGDLKAFRAALSERFELAGWVAKNPSHVETVFRNAVVGSYASGRDAQMRQPEVLAARPFWQVMGVSDARTRDTHKAAHGKCLRASDPFWERCPLTWGHNCRCRKVSRSADDVRRLGLEVVDGSTIKGLPDDGWDSSSTLIR